MKILLLFVCLLFVFHSVSALKSFETEDIAPNGRICFTERLWLAKNAERLQGVIARASSLRSLYAIGSNLFNRVGLKRGPVYVPSVQPLSADPFWLCPPSPDRKIELRQEIEKVRSILLGVLRDLTERLPPRRIEASLFRAQQETKFRPFSTIAPGTIEIVHGGGLRYILDFLNGVTEGYPLEGASGAARPLGIQVHPLYEGTKQDWQAFVDRSKNYAMSRGPLEHLDFPVILRASVPTACLEVADNPYEAGLRSCFRKCLRDVTITMVNDEKDKKTPLRLLVDARRPYLPGSIRRTYYDQQTQLAFLQLEY